MWAVVGLGNPGRRYAGTRHNVGFLFVRKLAKQWQVRVRKRIFHSKAGVAKRNDEEILLAMPQTYMNQSGLAVKGILEGRNLEPEQVVVVYDDLDIPLGEIRIKEDGGPGSHRGMISIVEEIHTTRFPRIRIGIAPPDTERDTVQYVLSPFSKHQEPLLEKSLSRAVKALELMLAGGVKKAMNIYNQRKKKGRAAFDEKSVIS
ncbi:MAG: aminoacyl-tRNA hydrolase [Candidatus Aminicenantes bacterium]